MDKTITAFAGLDAHAESTAIGVAEVGRAAPRFVGTVGPKFTELNKALTELGDPSKLLIVYEADRAGMPWRGSSSAQATAVRWWRPRRYRAGGGIGSRPPDAMRSPWQVLRAPGSKPASSSKRCCCATVAARPAKPPGTPPVSATSLQCLLTTVPRTSLSGSIARRSPKRRHACSA